MKRVPRKLKKKFKKIWSKRLGEEILIVKKSIKKDFWGWSIVRVWGCEIKTKKYVYSRHFGG